MKLEISSTTSWFVDAIPGVLELDIIALFGCARVSANVLDVGLEHIWQSVERILISFHKLGDIADQQFLVFRSFGRTATNDDWAAVHVHLAIADFIEPCPGECSFAGRKISGDCEAVCIRIGSTSVATNIASTGPCWATSFNGMDYLEDAVLGWWLVISDGNLA